MQSQVRLNRICGHLIRGNLAEVFPSAWLRSTLQKDLLKYNVAAVGDTSEAYLHFSSFEVILERFRKYHFVLRGPIQNEGAGISCRRNYHVLITLGKSCLLI